MAVKDESDEVKRSTYQELFCSADKAWWHSILTQVTPAGVSCYKEKPVNLKTPEDFLI